MILICEVEIMKVLKLNYQHNQLSVEDSQLWRTAAALLWFDFRGTTFHIFSLIGWNISKDMLIHLFIFISYFIGESSYWYRSIISTSFSQQLICPTFHKNSFISVSSDLLGQKQTIFFNPSQNDKSSFYSPGLHEHHQPRKSWRKCCRGTKHQPDLYIWGWDLQHPVVQTRPEIQTRVPALHHGARIYSSNRFWFQSSHQQGETSETRDHLCCSVWLCCVLLCSEAHSDRKHQNSEQKPLDLKILWNIH